MGILHHTDFNPRRQKTPRLVSALAVPGELSTTVPIGQTWNPLRMMGTKACGLCWPLTCTDDTGILPVPAVVHAPAVVPAHLQGGLVPAALHVVQEDAAGAGAKASVARGIHGLATAQLPAHHLGIPQVPLVITHRPPRAAVVQLHAALAAVPAARQPHAGPWHMAHGTRMSSLQPGTLLSPQGPLQQGACMAAARPGMGLGAGITCGIWPGCGGHWSYGCKGEFGVNAKGSKESQHMSCSSEKPIF